MTISSSLLVSDSDEDETLSEDDDDIGLSTSCTFYFFTFEGGALAFLTLVSFLYFSFLSRGCLWGESC